MNTKNTPNSPRPEYSQGHVFFARLFFLAEAAISLYLVFLYKMEFGILYLIYSLVSVFLLMPALRCAQCEYYGRRCSLGWGRWASKMIPDENRNLFQNLTGLNIIFWPLRLIPVLIGINTVIQSIIMGQFYFDQHYLFGTYLLVLLLQRLIFRNRVCPANLESSADSISIPQNS